MEKSLKKSNIWAKYDGKHNGAHCYIIDKDGEFHFSDEVFHVQPNPFVDSGFEEKIA